MEDGSCSTCGPQNDSRGPSLCMECMEVLSQLRNPPLRSSLQHLLSETKRHIPSISEEVQVREIIADANRRMAAIDATSARIQLLLNELAQERVKIQEFANRHKVMVAPIWHIPPEVISCIFTFCIPQPRSPQEITRSTIKLSLLVSSVDRNWRDVALSTPQLWTTMFLDDKSFLLDSISIPQLLLRRSGNLPLSLHVCSTGNAPSPSLLSFVGSLSQRWEHLSLETEAGNLASILPTPIQLPLLRTLELKMSWTEGADVNPLTYFTDAPLLHHFTTSNTFCASFKALPWKQLRTWDSVVAPQDYPTIFDWAPNLETCFIQPSRLLHGQTLTENLIGVAHKLTYLHISTGLVSNISAQMNHLPHFPSLRRLFIYFDKRVYVLSTQDTIISFFARSGALLEDLTIAVNIPVSSLRQCLTHTPALVTLQIHRIASNYMLETLFNPPSLSEAFIMPGLVNLRLSGKIYFNAQSVTNIIKARWKNPTETMGEESLNMEGIPTVAPYPRTLKSVHILPPRSDKFEPGEKKELLAFRKKGFDVKIEQLDRIAFLRHET